MRTIITLKPYVKSSKIFGVKEDSILGQVIALGICMLIGAAVGSVILFAVIER